MDRRQREGGQRTDHGSFPTLGQPSPPAPLPLLTSSGLGCRPWGSRGPTPASTGTTVFFAWARKAGSQGRHDLGRPLGLEKGGGEGDPTLAIQRPLAVRSIWPLSCTGLTPAMLTDAGSPFRPLGL